MESNSGSDLKNNNRNRVFNLVRDSGSITKPNVSRELGLSLPTAIQHMRELEEMGAIKEGVSVGYTGGRRAKGYSVNENYRYAVGMELTLEEIRLTVVDFCGNQIQADVTERPLIMDQHYYKELGGLLNESLEKWKIAPEKVIGVGIAVQGLVTNDYQQVYYGGGFGIAGLSIDELGSYIPYPCRMYNNSDAAGYAEILGDAKCRDAVLIRLEKEVGGAVMIDGKLYRGENGKSGKVAHMQLVRNGKMCYCGRKGCFNTLCNRKVLEDACEGELAEFFDKLENGDQTCREVWKEYLQSLAEGIVNLRMLFDSRVIVGGMIAEYIKPYFQELLKKAVVLDTFDNPETYVQLSSRDYLAPALGAASILLHEFWQNF